MLTKDSKGRRIWREDGPWLLCGRAATCVYVAAVGALCVGAGLWRVEILQLLGLGG
jgi:hypothetical protein